jgi:hypothetical protein
MPRSDCGLCHGSGVIYDWRASGDPCPECTGNVSMSSKVKMGTGCFGVLVALAGVGAAVVHYLGWG